VHIQTDLHNETNCTLGYTKHMRGVDCSDHYIASSQFMKRIKKKAVQGIDLLTPGSEL